MATNTDGSLTLDLVLRSEGYRAGMDKVGRINDQKMRAMEARAEKAGKAIGKSLDSSALIASSVLDQALDMLGRTSRQAGQAKKPVQSAQDKVLAEWKTRQKELGEAWKSYREPLQDLTKLNEALVKNSSDKLDKALLNLSETGKLSLANVGKAAYADAARLASRQMTLMLLDGLFGWVASVGTEKPKVDDKAGKGQAKAGDDEKEQPSLQSQVFKQWLLQMNSVWGAYRAPLQDISGMTDELFRNASEKLEKSLFNFATTGKLSLSNFAKTVIDDVARIAARQLSMLALDHRVGEILERQLARGGKGEQGVLHIGESVGKQHVHHSRDVLRLVAQARPGGVHLFDPTAHRLASARRSPSSRYLGTVPGLPGSSGHHRADIHRRCRHWRGTLGRGSARSRLSRICSGLFQ